MVFDLNNGKELPLSNMWKALFGKADLRRRVKVSSALHVIFEMTSGEDIE